MPAMPPRHPTKWKLEPHTEAKHSILRKYLGAWFPKLSWKGRLVFVDGFAGPGEYVGGEPGSPIIALNALLEHKANLASCEMKFLFVEERLDRLENLKEKLDSIDFPQNVQAQALHGTFADVVGDVLDVVESGGHRLAPAFVMVDPFGPKGLPMDLMHRITAHPRSELLISLMYESMARWRNQPAFERHLDDLYGCPDWHEFDAERRKEFLHDLYVEQLKKGGMTFVRSFEMRDSGNRTEYFLVFATKHIEGLKAIKRVMWSVDPSGQFQFSDATRRDQATLFEPEPDFQLLERLIRATFGAASFRIESLAEFVWIETAFLDSHIRRPILIPGEKAGRIEVLTSRKRNYTYPAGTVLRFVS
jgi:three-Cys-motif partner protein